MSLPKIAFYQPYPHGLDGLQKVVTELAESIASKGFSPLILVPEEGIYTADLQRRQIPFLVCNPGPSWNVYGRGSGGLSYIFSVKRFWHLLSYWRRLRKLLVRENVSILHCNDYRAVLLAAPAGRMLGIPCIWHMHGFIESIPANLLTANLVHWTIPVSQGMLDYVRLPRWMLGKCKVIYNGVDPSAENDLTESPEPIILAVGNLHPRKGYEFLLHSFKPVLEKMPEAQCWIAGGPFGDGSHFKELQTLAQTLQLGASMTFLGLADNVPELMGKVRLLAVPSRIEAFGLVATEAMSHSLPVVASRSGGLKDIVVDGETGYLVEVDDNAAFSEKLLRLLLDPLQSRAMGRAGKARLNSHFTRARMVDDFVDFYKTLLTKSQSGVMSASHSMGSELEHPMASDPISIAIVSEPGKAGVKTHVVDLLTHLDLRRFLPIYYYSKQRSDEAYEQEIKNLVERGIRCVEVTMDAGLNWGKDFRAFRQLTGHLQKQRPSILHLHSSKAGGLGRIASLFLHPRPKVIYTPHAMAGYRSRFYLWLERLLGLLSDRLIAVSASESADFAHWRIPKPDNVRIIPLGMNPLPTDPKAIVCPPTLGQSGLAAASAIKKMLSCFSRSLWR